MFKRPEYITSVKRKRRLIQAQFALDFSRQANIDPKFNSPNRGPPPAFGGTAATPNPIGVALAKTSGVKLNGKQVGDYSRPD